MPSCEELPASEKEAVDLIIEPEWIIPIEPLDRVLSEHSIVVNGGLIVDILPTSLANARFAAKHVENLPGHVVLPGLVNLHCHAAMSLLRGYADDLPLMEWLEKRIWPAEAAFAREEFVRVGSALACLEMLRGGVTCFNDMYFFPEATAEAALSCGIRASLGMVVIDFPTAYANGPSDYIAKGRSFYDSFQNHDLIDFCWAPHAPYTVSDDTFVKIAQLASDMAVPIHVHIHETTAEVATETDRYGMRPIARLKQLGILGPNTIGVHAVHLNDDDIDTLLTTGTNLAHCPTSNLKLGSGIAPVPTWIKRGINFGFGTDGAASNNRMDIWREMRQSSLLAKGISGDAGMLNSHHTLRQATLGGASALGLAHKIGSIVPGKCADLVAVALDDWTQQPVFDPASHLIHVTDRKNVSTVWVNGRCVVKKHTLMFDGLNHLMHEVKEWQNRILKC